MAGFAPDQHHQLAASRWVCAVGNRQSSSDHTCCGRGDGRRGSGANVAQKAPPLSPPDILSLITVSALGAARQAARHVAG
jgi:hypothetical protein